MHAIRDVYHFSIYFTFIGILFLRGFQGVWNRREIQMTRPALHMIIHALQTVLHFNKKYNINNTIPILNISYSNGVPSAKHA